MPIDWDFIFCNEYMVCNTMFADFHSFLLRVRTFSSKFFPMYEFWLQPFLHDHFSIANRPKYNFDIYLKNLESKLFRWQFSEISLESLCITLNSLRDDGKKPHNQTIFFLPLDLLLLWIWFENPFHTSKHGFAVTVFQLDT